MGWIGLCMLIALAATAGSCVIYVSSPKPRPTRPARIPAGARKGRVAVSVSAGEVDRFDLPVEIPLDKAAMVKAAGSGGTVDQASIRVVEIDADGNIIDVNVPCQFDSDDGRTGTLIFALKGVTKASYARNFLVHPGGGAEPVGQVQITDGVMYQGQESFRIDAANATWIYHKAGAGFAALVDADGNDWISFRPTGGSDGQYRGIPNLVYPEG